MICPKCKKEMCIGMLGPGGNGITNKRTRRAWACNECKLVLIDCN